MGTSSKCNKLLVDPSAISPDGSLACARFVVSHSGTRVAYGLSAGGGDWQEWHIVDVATGKQLSDKLQYIKYYAPAFTRDGTGIYYSRFPAPSPGKELIEADHDCKVYFHKIGTPAVEDLVVYERPEPPTWQLDLQATDDGRYLVITVGDGEIGDRMEEQIVYIDFAGVHKKPVALIDRYEADDVFLGNEGPLFFIQTTSADHDVRVAPLHSYKFVAALQSAQAGDAPVLLRVEHQDRARHRAHAHPEDRSENGDARVFRTKPRPRVEVTQSRPPNHGQCQQEGPVGHEDEIVDGASLDRLRPGRRLLSAAAARRSMG